MKSIVTIVSSEEEAYHAVLLAASVTRFCPANFVALDVGDFDLLDTLQSEQNILVHPNIILLDDITPWTDLTKDYLSSSYRDYRGNIKGYGRNEIIVLNDTSVTRDLLRIANSIKDNWTEFRLNHYEGMVENDWTVDLLLDTAMGILDRPSMEFDVPTFVDMSNEVNFDLDRYELEEDWTETLNYTVKHNYTIGIGNYSQQFPILNHNRKFAEKILNVQNIL